MLGTLDEAQIEQVLSGASIGRVGCQGEGRVYVVPLTCAYSDGAVYAHTTEGLKLRLMRANPQVCFEVEDVQDLATWRSVIAWGRFEELTGPAAGDGMRRMMTRLMPLMTRAGAVPTHGLPGHGTAMSGQAGVVFRIVLEEKTGRFEQRG